MTEKLTVTTEVRAPLDTVWASFTEPEHIRAWNHASDDWRCPRAENDLRPGGSFSARMESADGKEGFDFGGTYDEVIPRERIAYTMDDGRKVIVVFAEEGDAVRVTETFDPEQENPPEMQRSGWQAILDNFKKHTEALA